MNRRVNQFIKAFNAKLVDEDHAFLIRHLKPHEAELFFRMHVADQYHALRVAYTVEELASSENEAVDPDILIRGALLHDIGRKKGDLNVYGKVFAVLMDSFFPRHSRKLGQSDGHGFLGRIRHMMFVYYHHPEIGAEILRTHGLIKEAEMAERHHMPARDEDAPELRLLRRADELN